MAGKFNAAYWTQKKAEDRIRYREPRIAGAKAAAELIHAHEGQYKLHRDVIVRALVDVMTNSYFLGEYQTWKEWFEAQEFTFKYETARWYMKEYRRAKRGGGPPASSQMTPQKALQAVKHALGTVERAFGIDPDGAAGEALVCLRRAKNFLETL